jgi:Flp pilus assembly protein TadB
MNHPAFSWALALAAFVVGYVGYGWAGVALAFTAVTFWLLLQFSRAVRVLRTAGSNPMGQVPNAVMLHARLVKGMRLPQILKITQSLGRPIGEAPPGVVENYAWTDGGGDEVRVVLHGGRLTEWALHRAAA